MTFKRYAPSALLAVGVTIGITLGMAAMIKTEFTPQDKSEGMTFDINPVQIDIPSPPERVKPKEAKRVETPPPPPVLDHGKTDKPTEPPVQMGGGVPTFKMPVLTTGAPIIVVSNRNVQPLVRVAPIMPPRAKTSGHCKVRFNVSAEGAPYDVTATYCTSSIFERSTVKSVQKWKYNPKIVNGRAVAMIGVENKVSYRLTDERGNVIPE